MNTHDNYSESFNIDHNVSILMEQLTWHYFILARHQSKVISIDNM